MPRIVGGSAKGRKLKAPAKDVRPATARARQALFDYLSHIIPDARVLDLYCGSGGLGLEAISRGAATAHFVDNSQKSLFIARQNAILLEFRELTEFTYQAEPEEVPFDIIFAAPPYKIAEPLRILEALHDAHIVVEGGVICLEYSRHTPEPKTDLFKLDRRRIYGETVIDVWDNPPTEVLETASPDPSISE
jgi:16S rRNA (guanine966-N2)-methyltransferase